MSTMTLSAIGQFKGSAFRLSTSNFCDEGYLPLRSLLGAGSRCWPIGFLGSSLDATGYASSPCERSPSFISAAWS